MKVAARHLYFNLWGLLQKKVYRNKVTPSERKSLHCVSCRTWVIIKSRQIWLLMARLGSKLLHALISCSFKRGGPYLMIMGRTWKIKVDFMFFCRKLWEFFRIYILQGIFLKVNKKYFFIEIHFPENFQLLFLFKVDWFGWVGSLRTTQPLSPHFPLK